MLALVIINLLLLAWDMTFSVFTIQELIKEYAHPVHQFYLPIHRDFLLYDAFFVSIFITELLIRWAIAVRRKTYYRWFFYPFVHWYDVLGCIPIGAFRWLRLLRIFSILYRLHRLGLVDFTKTYLWKTAKKYLAILTEEVSDRVVVNVLEGIQEELKEGTPVTEKIIREVILPHKGTLVEFVSHRIQLVTQHQYTENRESLENYVKRLIEQAMINNDEFRNLSRVPVVGPLVAIALEKSVREISFNVINGMMEDLGSPDNKVVIEKITDGVVETLLLSESDQTLNDLTVKMAIDALEIVKDQVKIQQWKLKEEEERAKRG